MMDLSALRRLRRKRRSRSPVESGRWAVIGKYAALVALVASFLVGVHALATMPALRVEQIQVHGLSRLTHRSIAAAIEASHNQPILLLSIDQVRDSLESIPAIRQASVTRRLPATLVIEVEERKALARVDFAGTILLTDEAGVLFPIGQPQPGDDLLALVINPLTPPNERRLLDVDRCALTALTQLAELRGGVPEGAFVDLRHHDRIELQPGPESALLWLDRADPKNNLENYFLYQSRVAELGPIRAVDLRFASRLTIHPEPQPTEDPMTPPAEAGTDAR
jgi:cell division septal protein FtsQ